MEWLCPYLHGGACSCEVSSGSVAAVWVPTTEALAPSLPGCSWGSRTVCVHVPRVFVSIQDQCTKSTRTIRRRTKHTFRALLYASVLSPGSIVPTSEGPLPIFWKRQGVASRSSELNSDFSQFRSLRPLAIQKLSLCSAQASQSIIGIP